MAEHGVLGIIVVALAIWIVRLHRELREERTERLKDMHEDFQTITKLQTGSIEIAAVMNEAIDELKERRAEIERERERERERTTERGPRR